MKEAQVKFSPCVIIPVYNNEGTVKDVARTCIDQGLPVIVVDDGSTDGSGDRVGDMQGVTVERLETNRGKGSALRAGFRLAGEKGYTHAVTCDADGQHDPHEIPLLLEAARRNPPAIIVGNRAMAKAGAPGSSRFGRAFSNFWLRVQTGRKVGDAQCGFRVYPVDTFNLLGTRCMRYELEHEVLVRAAYNRVGFVDVPVSVTYADKIVSHFRKLRDNVRFSLLNASLTIIRWTGLFLIMRRRALRKKGWVHQKTLGTPAGYAFFRCMYRLTGRRVAYAWLRLIMVYYNLFSPRLAREASAAYLKKRFPDASPAQIRMLRKKHFREFAQTILDRVIIGARGFDDFKIRSDGIEHIEDAKNEGKGILLLGAHMGNFEVGGFALSDTGMKIKIVGIRKELERIGKYLHSHYRDKKIPMDMLTIRDDDSFSFLEIPKALERGEILAILADRMWGESSVSCPILGHEARFPAGPFMIASITGAPIVSWFVVKDAPDTYHFYGMPPFHVPRARRKEREKVLKQAVGNYVANIEKILQKYPFAWYNFYDFWEEDLM
ncbi:MAG: glycosyltransferase [Pseudomonadota bacterium]